MGTNFYWKPEPEPCHTCGHDPVETLHIGKSSAGWTFLLRVYPSKGIHDLKDWVPLWESGTIEDEYGRELTPQDMLSWITDRRSELPDPEWLRANHAVPGPNGLVRRSGCKHGEGTWDIATGDFC